VCALLVSCVGLGPADRGSGCGEPLLVQTLMLLVSIDAMQCGEGPQGVSSGCVAVCWPVFCRCWC